MGKLIVLEGIDGSGKTTQLELLREALEAKKISHEIIAYPNYDNKESALIKMYLNGEISDNPMSVNAYAASSFYAAERYISYKKYWESQYLAGTLIISGRYTTSNAIYQCSKVAPDERDAYLDWLEGYEYGLLGLPRPSQVLFLDMPPEYSIDLVIKRGSRDIHEKDYSYLQNSYLTALYASERLGWTNINCVKDGEILSRQEVHFEICKNLEMVFC